MKLCRNFVLMQIIVHCRCIYSILSTTYIVPWIQLSWANQYIDFFHANGCPHPFVYSEKNNWCIRNCCFELVTEGSIVSLTLQLSPYTNDLVFNLFWVHYKCIEVYHSWWNTNIPGVPICSSILQNILSRLFCLAIIDLTVLL